MKTASLGVVLASGNVLRCHTMPCLHRQTTGQHTWRTMVLLHWIYHPAYPPPAVTFAMLMHDVPEIHTGDTPGDIKADHRGLSDALAELEARFVDNHDIAMPDLPALEEQLIKLCDRTDLLFYALDELEMGNVHMTAVVHRAYDMVREIAELTQLEEKWPRIRDLLGAVRVRYAGVTCV